VEEAHRLARRVLHEPGARGRTWAHLHRTQVNAGVFEHRPVKTSLLVIAEPCDERGVNAVLTPLVIVFSGSLLPLDFFPDALRPFLHVQPFAGLVDIPFRIYFADLAGGAALQGLALQAGWTVVLVGLGRLAMERMMRRLEMQGG